MHHKQRIYLVNPWDTADIVSTGFDLILLICDPGLNHKAGGNKLTPERAEWLFLEMSSAFYG